MTISALLNKELVKMKIKKELMQIVKILSLCFTIVSCGNSSEFTNNDSNAIVEIEQYKSKSGYQYLTLNALEKETDSYHPASFLINGIWLHHFKKNPYVLSVTEGKFNIKVSSVSKLPAFIEDLYISSGDSVVIDIKMEDDLSPLID